MISDILPEYRNGVLGPYLMLIAGIAGNLVLIITNAFISIFGDPGLFFSAYQQRSFFYLGDNAFYLFKFNNCSSTDFASHYFWIITVYLWLRSKKITWGEIAALAFLDVLVYSLTASLTSFVCITLVIVFAVNIHEKKCANAINTLFSKYTGSIITPTIDAITIINKFINNKLV